MVNKKIINPKGAVIRLFSDQNKERLRMYHAQYQDINIELPFVSCPDEDSGLVRTYYYNDTEESIWKRIRMDKKVEQFLPLKLFAQFLIDVADPNAIMVMEELVLLWDDEEGQSAARDNLEDKYNDEYAQHVADCDFLGQLWAERQIVVVNVSTVYQVCLKQYIDQIDGAFTEFFMETLLSTIFHELRHLFYECNKIVPIGDDTPYPQDGGMEDKVEHYGDIMSYRCFSVFYDIVQKKQLEDLCERESRKHTIQNWIIDRITEDKTKCVFYITVPKKSECFREDKTVQKIEEILDRNDISHGHVDTVSGAWNLNRDWIETGAFDCIVEYCGVYPVDWKLDDVVEFERMESDGEIIVFVDWIQDGKRIPNN